MGLLVGAAAGVAGAATLRPGTVDGAHHAAVDARFSMLGGRSGARTVVTPGSASAVRPVGRVATVPPDEAQRQAREILDQKRFRHKSPPRPLRGVLRWIGDRLQPITRPIGSAFESLAENTALAWFAGFAMVAAIVAAIVALMARRERARVAGLTDRGWGGVAGTESFDPTELERAASAAEDEGRFADAVRLRFQAGLAHLALMGRVPAGLVEPNGEIARDLASARFDLLSLRFDEIVYGDHTAVATDVADARREWPTVLQEARG